MEIIIFCGIQASGKSTFYKAHFFNSHVRISLDLLNTRNKEDRFLKTCFEVQQKIVVDNTNPSRLERSKYIDLGKQHKYKVIGYFFSSSLEESIDRNDLRLGKEKINVRGIIATAKKLEVPSFEEGFDELYFVHLEAEKGFIIQHLQHEV